MLYASLSWGEAPGKVEKLRGVCVMAVREIVELLDDLDGSTASETVEFAVDGVSYEIDLNEVHCDEFRNALAGYVSHGRKIGRNHAGGHSGAKASRGRSDDAKQARAFAVKHGLPVNQRGRVSEEILQAWRANNPELARPAAEPLSA